jgi:hypothetical protein
MTEITVNKQRFIQDTSGNLAPVVSQMAAGYTATAIFTAAAAAYSANDIVDVAKQMTWLDKDGNAFGGGELMITTAELLIAETALQASEASYSLKKYNITPPSARADNAAWDLASGDRASFQGSTDLGTPVDIGSSLYVKTTQINEQITVPATGKTFAELVTAAGATLTATARTVTLHAVAL